MKTVSTKLDNNLHSRFIEICNEDGKCQSEFLRDLIESVCDDLENGEVTTQDLEIDVEESEEGEPVKQAIIKRVSYDDGKTWHDVKPIPELTNVTVES